VLGLQEAQWVYVKRGGCGLSLASAYTGRIVIPSDLKYFVIEVGGCQESFTVDRLNHT
jgi:hypothetical protein